MASSSNLTAELLFPVFNSSRNPYGDRRILSGLKRLAHTHTENMETKKSRILTGARVAHGSPGYENAETIAKIYGDPNNGERVTIEFESDFFTSMSMESFAEFIKNGKVFYTQQFPDGNAFEIMEVLP